MGNICFEHGPFVRKLRKRYCQTAELFGLRPVLIRASGAYFFIDRSCAIQNAIAVQGSWEPTSVNHLAGIGRQHSFDYFIDVGAHTGFYSVVFGRHRITRRQIAFEPLYSNFQTLSRNIRWNGLQELIEVFPVALGNINSDVILALGEPFNKSNGVVGGSGPVRHTVKQVRFDDIVKLSRTSILLKMDAEFQELNALRGMERTLRENDCYLQIESFQEYFPEVRAYMGSLGYQYLGQELDHYFTNIPALLPK